ncbi:MAG: hypothetical protein PHF94_01260 [Methanothrix sp.]|nr:hypothetical protein [Methanothrix sp.]MDD4579206.1 hypothetical protein [Methanothrix sp.]
MMKSEFIRSIALIFALLFLFIFHSALAAAVNPQEDWNWTFGGQWGDGAWCLQETSDGGNILAGNTASKGEGSDLYLIKTDEAGNCTWSRTLGGSGEDVGYYVEETEDGGFIVTGSTDSYSMGDELLWLVKTDRNGSPTWEKTFGGFVSSSGDGGWSVQETVDGGYIVTGYTQSLGNGRKDLWLIKTDGDGGLIWDRTFGGREDDVGMSVQNSQDGGYIVAGRTASFGKGEDDIWLLKTDLNGGEIWNVTFGGKKDDAGFQVVALASGYALVSRTDSGKDDEKIKLIRVDSNGRKIWERSYKGSSAASLQLTDDGGFIIAGRVDNKETGRDALIIKTNSIGIMEWSITLGGSSDDIGTFAIQRRDGSYMMAGITSSFGLGREDAWLVKIRAEPSRDESETPLLNRTISFPKR